VKYRPARQGGEFAPWLQALKGRSGVYVIRSSWLGTVLYVGESHSGNLYRTICRHFWTWNDRSRRAHYTVGLLPVEVAVKVTRPADAVEEQNRLILRLRPEHNLTAPRDEVPF
jgi:uncharacterized RDD family membrane protein YckC